MPLVVARVVALAVIGLFACAEGFPGMGRREKPTPPPRASAAPSTVSSSSSEESFSTLSIPDAPVRPEAGSYLPFSPAEGPDVFWAIRQVRNAVTVGEKSGGFGLFSCYRKPNKVPGHPDCYLARIHAAPSDVAWPSAPGSVASSAPTAPRVEATAVVRTERKEEIRREAEPTPPTLAELAQRPQQYIGEEVTIEGRATKCDYFTGPFLGREKDFFCVRLTDEKAYVYVFFSKRKHQDLGGALTLGQKLQVRAVLRDPKATEYRAVGLSWQAR